VCRAGIAPVRTGTGLLILSPASYNHHPVHFLMYETGTVVAALTEAGITPK